MKKFNIGVMLLDLNGEYTMDFISGVKAAFDGKDVNIVLCPVKLPNLPYGIFEYQYWAGLSLLESDSFDGIIIVSSFFTSTVPVDVFSEWLSGLSGKPIVSIGTDLNLPNVSYIKSECETAYRKLFSHLVNEHGVRRVAFMSANNTVSEEARERFAYYKQMLKENGLEYDESIVFDGNFTTVSAETALKDIKSKDQINFDAIICANDLMAVGVYSHFAKIGVSVPDDVIVTGFDDSVQARMIEPTLTTISQEINTQGYLSAKLLWQKISGETVPKENFVSLKNLYRQSCGCLRNTDLNLLYKTEEGKLVRKEVQNMSSTLAAYMKNTDEKVKIYYLLDILQVSENLTDLFYRFKQILFSVDIRRVAVVLYDEPIKHDKNINFKVPEEVELALVLDRENDIERVNPGIRFNPYREIFPENVFNQDYSEYILEPIFFGEKQYGYFLIKLGEPNYNQCTIYLKALSNVIASSYEYTKKQEENQMLSKLNENLVFDNKKLKLTSKTDELTQVYNRRGFIFAGEQILALSQSYIKSGTVFFCDMDDLKKINDTYGHHMGDIAIQTVALALKETFSLNDVIGRLGGDEFAVISGEVNISEYENKYHKVLERCETLVKEKGLPFSLTVSMGAVPFSSKDSSLQKLLSNADEKQYEIKKCKKANKQNNR